MRKVRFTGINQVGTLRPRRMWSPGEVLEVEDDVAEELNRQPGFRMLRRSPRKKEKIQEPKVEGSAEEVGSSTDSGADELELKEPEAEETETEE